MAATLKMSSTGGSAREIAARPPQSLNDRPDRRSRRPAAAPACRRCFRHRATGRPARSPARRRGCREPFAAATSLTSAASPCNSPSTASSGARCRTSASAVAHEIDRLGPSALPSRAERKQGDARLVADDAAPIARPRRWRCRRAASPSDSGTTAQSVKVSTSGVCAAERRARPCRTRSRPCARPAAGPTSQSAARRTSPVVCDGAGDAAVGVAAARRGRRRRGVACASKRRRAFLREPFGAARCRAVVEPRRRREDRSPDRRPRRPSDARTAACVSGRAGSSTSTGSTMRCRAERGAPPRSVRSSADFGKDDAPARARRARAHARRESSLAFGPAPISRGAPRRRRDARGRRRRRRSARPRARGSR